MGFRCLHKSNKYKCIFCIYLLSKRKERVHPEDHLVSRYSIDGAGSSPGERARESDRYAGKTQVGHRSVLQRAPPARFIGGASKWPFLSPQTFPERRRRQVAIFRSDRTRGAVSLSVETSFQVADSRKRVRDVRARFAGRSKVVVGAQSTRVLAGVLESSRDSSAIVRGSVSDLSRADLPFVLIDIRGIDR